MTTASFIEDFYPTPPELIERLLEGVDLEHLEEVLDLGAGRGDIAEYIVEVQERRYYRRQRSVKIDVVEINPDLQAMLKGKGFRLVHDDILTFKTHKVYDLIIANFPFSIGADCLQKALTLLERSGGQLRCLVNAETLKNPFSHLRQTVKRKLEDLGAEIEYLPGEFTAGERRTKVESALIKLTVERPETPSILLDALNKAPESRVDEEAGGDSIVANNFAAAMVARFDLECRLGVKLIEEYFSLRHHIKNRIKTDEEEYDYSKELIELKVEGAYKTKASHINNYLSGLRYKFWSLLLEDPRFNGLFTSNILSDLNSKLSELKGYDFTLFNIQALIEEMKSKIVAGIEAAIIKLFDECTAKFAFNEDIHNGNVHYFTGWKSNKAHKITRRIVLPMNGFSAYGSGLDYTIHERLRDMVKVFQYLSEDRADVRLLVGNACESAERRQNYRGIDLRYFEVSFFKKRTAHIKFTDQRLLDKLNIYAARQRGWLPPSYGKKVYDDMSAEEREVVDSFQGREAYEEVVRNAKFYIIEESTLLQLAGAPEADEAEQFDAEPVTPAPLQLAPQPQQQDGEAEDETPARAVYQHAPEAATTDEAEDEAGVPQRRLFAA